MKVVYHPAVQEDVSRILRHYDSINDRLGDEFWEELTAFILEASANPQRFHFQTRDREAATRTGLVCPFFDIIGGGGKMARISESAGQSSLIRA